MLNILIGLAGPLLVLALGLATIISSLLEGSGKFNGATDEKKIAVVLLLSVAVAVVFTGVYIWAAEPGWTVAQSVMVGLVFATALLSESQIVHKVVFKLSPAAYGLLKMLIQGLFGNKIPPLPDDPGASAVKREAVPLLEKGLA